MGRPLPQPARRRGNALAPHSSAPQTRRPVHQNPRRAGRSRPSVRQARLRVPRRKARGRAASVPSSVRAVEETPRRRPNGEPIKSRQIPMPPPAPIVHPASRAIPQVGPLQPLAVQPRRGQLGIMTSSDPDDRRNRACPDRPVHSRHRERRGYLNRVRSGVGRLSIAQDRCCEPDPRASRHGLFPVTS